LWYIAALHKVAEFAADDPVLERVIGPVRLRMSQVFDDLGCGRERYPPQRSEGAQRPTVFGTALVIFHRLAGAA
jgi:hypothetical protein